MAIALRGCGAVVVFAEIDLVADEDAGKVWIGVLAYVGKPCGEVIEAWSAGMSGSGG